MMLQQRNGLRPSTSCHQQRGSIGNPAAATAAAATQRQRRQRRQRHTGDGRAAPPLVAAAAAAAAATAEPAAAPAPAADAPAAAAAALTRIARPDPHHAPAPVTSLAQLPPDLRNATALLEAPSAAAPGGVSRVFVLGVSHVSAVSCEQVRRLVRLVRPGAVMVELCKDRVGLLVDPENPDRRAETWHCRQVTLEGLPAGEGEDPAGLWPTEAQLRPLLAARIGAAVTTQDIEADCARLLATGLFGRARPAAANALRGEAPQFGAVKPEEEDDDDDEDDWEQQQDGGAEATSSSSSGSHAGEVALQMVPPLGGLRFVLEPRALPVVSSLEVRLDSSLAGGPVTAQALQEVASALLAEAKAKAAAAGSDNKGDDDKQKGEEEEKKAEDNKEGEEGEEEEEEEKKQRVEVDASLALYLRARAALSGLFPDPSAVAVAFDGVEGGRVEALVRARRPGDPEYVSGLEGSAVGGEGVGIDSFRPQRPSVQLSPGMLLPAEAAERLAAARAARQAGRVLAPPEGWTRRTRFRFWEQPEVKDEFPPELPPNPAADAFAALMTGLYARLQAAAGEQAGVAPGAAWRAAMAAASEVGAQQVLLGDRPTDVSQRRLAESIAAASGARLVGSLALLIGGLVAAATHALPDVEAAAAALGGAPALGDAGVAGLAALAGLALAWPVLAPFAEVWRFGRLGGDEVEAAVAITEPLQQNLDRPFYVWGEDALLAWPGAERPLIDERDAYMARVLAAAAVGRSPNVPAYVADVQADGAAGEGQLVWRYLVPEGAPARAAPAGAGDGAYEPLRQPAPAAVVAVVGSAHVRGMCRAWDDALAKAGELEDLLQA